MNEMVFDGFSMGGDLRLFFFVFRRSGRGRGLTFNVSCFFFILLLFPVKGK